jgi:hypothetical protein
MNKKDLVTGAFLAMAQLFSAQAQGLPRDIAGSGQPGSISDLHRAGSKALLWRHYGRCTRTLLALVP